MLDIVDFVLVYKGKTLNKIDKSSYGYIHGKKTKTPYIPLDIFNKLKFDYYFKGYEYQRKNIPEVRILKQKKIKIRFGPKKNIFSSTKILKGHV